MRMSSNPPYKWHKEFDNKIKCYTSVFLLGSGCQKLFKVHAIVWPKYTLNEKNCIK